MKPLQWLVLGILLMAASQATLAQHHGGHSGGGATAPTGAPSNDDMKGFDRAMALQATPDQAAQFQKVKDSAGLARKNAQDLLKLTQANPRPDTPPRTDTLADDVDEAQSSNERFVQSLTSGQKTGLKDLTKKLGKANADVTKQTKGLRDPHLTDPKQIADLVTKLDKALGDMQTQQAAIGDEMGISGQASAQ